MISLNPTSVNTVRVLTFHGKVIAAALRIGGTGTIIDNLHSNGRLKERKRSMVCFIIALRSKKTTEHWELVERDFNNTLSSIFNQTDKNFKVFVACNEMPNIEIKYDHNCMEFILVDFPIPNTWVECCRDRAMKLMACTIKIRSEFNKYCEPDGGVFIFPVDADDLISNRVVAYINKYSQSNGFKSYKGYVWKKGEKFVTLSPWFGGSCNCMKLYKDELADRLPNKKDFFKKGMGDYLIKNYKICWDDHEVIDKFHELGRDFKRFPFPSTIYVLGTGENISEKDPRKNSEKGRFEKMTGIKMHPIALLRKCNPFDKKYFGKKIQREFGLLN